MVFDKSSKQYLCRGCGKNNDLKSPPNTETRCSCGRKLGLLVDDSPYFLLKRLGHGSYASVYQAYREQDNQCSYAIKIFKTGEIDSDCLQSSLKKEIEGLKSLQKVENIRVPKYIAHSFPASESEGDFVIVLEFIDGDNLEKSLNQRNNLTDGNSVFFKEEEIILFFIDLLETIHIVHTIGKILHRDIKPQNIIRQNSDKKLYLVDFGSSKVLNDNADFTDVVFQTSAYAPPERSKDVDKEKAGLSEFTSQEKLEIHKHTRDLYSLAITMSYLITGKPCNSNRKDPFPNKEWEKWMGDVCEKAPKLGTILKKMLSFYPPDRYQSALEVLLIVRTIAWKINKGDEWLIRGWWLIEVPKQFKGTNDFLIESSVQDFLKASQEYEKIKVGEIIDSWIV
jgi:serine/threonine protein kinase